MVRFENMYLIRLLKLTEDKEIIWKEVTSIIEGSRRYEGIGLNHIFVIKLNKNIENYVGYRNKYLNQIETSWEFVRDDKNELDDFIFEILDMLGFLEENEELHKKLVKFKKSVGFQEIKPIEMKSAFQIMDMILKDPVMKNFSEYEFREIMKG